MMWELISNSISLAEAKIYSMPKFFTANDKYLSLSWNTSPVKWPFVGRDKIFVWNQQITFSWDH